MLVLKSKDNAEETINIGAWKVETIEAYLKERLTVRT